MAGEIIRQRRFGIRTSFCFGPDAMSYGFGDWRSVATQSIPYEALDLTSRSDFSVGNIGYVTRWTWLLVPGVLGLQLFGDDSRWFGPALLAMLAIAGLVAATVAFEVTEVRFVEVATLGSDADGVRRFLRVIRDGQEAHILDELERHWRARLRRAYAVIDAQGDLAGEVARFDRLCQLGVIDTAELAEARRRLGVIAAAPSVIPHDAPLH